MKNSAEGGEGSEGEGGKEQEQRDNKVRWIILPREERGGEKGQRTCMSNKALLAHPPAFLPS